jgi:hypothetical protein
MTFNQQVAKFIVSETEREQKHDELCEVRHQRHRYQDCLDGYQCRK